jgi:endoglucanase
MKKTVLTLLTLFFVTYNYAQETTPAFEMNARLGRGINMGNAFEAPTETAWSNPWRPEYFGIMSELGFSHVRIPIQMGTRSQKYGHTTLYHHTFIFKSHQRGR